MRQIVYKYDLEPGLVTYDLPHGAWILSCAWHQNKPSIWVLVDPDQQETTPRRLLLIGTGFSLESYIPGDADLYHVGTMLTEGGTYVFHVFEVLGGTE